METIKFLQRTDNRNIKCHINVLVKQHMRLREEELDERRRSLQEMLELENLQYDEELALLMQARLEESARQRQLWIGTMRLERERAEEELLKLKNQQRELENCEEMSHLQSKQLLIETKQAQRYQIEEKKALRWREQQIELMWLEALKKLELEKEKHNEFEEKLRKVIAGTTQLKNTQQFEQMKALKTEEALKLKEENNLDNERALLVDRQYKELDKIHQKRKQHCQNDTLQQQIQENQKSRDLKIADEQEQEFHNQTMLEIQILNDLDQNERKKVQNREWHKYYLEHAQNERTALHERDKQLESLQVGRECVLYPENKKPYGKAVR